MASKACQPQSYFESEMIQPLDSASA